MICEGPKSNTLVDHWLMIWQEEVSLIIMLTNLTEGGKVLFTERLFIFLNFKFKVYKINRTLRSRRSASSRHDDVTMNDVHGYVYSSI